VTLFVLMLVLSAVVLAGCSGPAQVTPPAPTAGTAALCRRLVAAIPDKVDDQSARDVRPDSPYTAAWGDPAITLACGVAQPAGLNAASQCFEVNGVGWYVQDRSDSYRFTTIGRKAYVEVTVPRHYGPQPANALIDLARPVSDHIPVVTPCV
jgi:hypothetical protein